MKSSPWRNAVLLSACLLASSGAVEGGKAQAFDFFGLFGSSDKPPPPSPDALPYALTFEIPGGERALEETLQNTSTLYRLRADAPPDGESLVRRVQADFAP